MSGIYDIGWLELLIGCSVIIIPILITAYYKTGLVKTLCISFARMAVQLFLVGIYLQYIFELNSTIINIGWTLIMLVAACFTIIKRSNLNIKPFIIPVLAGVIGDVLINGLIFVFIAIGPDKFFNARYIIPIIGMIIGNCINTTIIGLRYFYQELNKNEDKYLYLLSQGATRSEALFPFFKEALIISFNPTIASTATIGLIWLPGMMTGQILGGSDPLTAIKYQIMIVVSIFSGSVLTVFLSLLLSQKTAFDSNDMLRKKVITDK